MTTDTSVETLGAPPLTGSVAAGAAEAKPTVLSRERHVQWPPAIRGSGQILGNFTGQVECDGDLFIGPKPRRSGHQELRA